MGKALNRQKMNSLHPTNIQPVNLSQLEDNNAAIPANINSVQVNGSTDIYFGNQIIYYGPVTITNEEPQILEKEVPVKISNKSNVKIKWMKFGIFFVTLTVTFGLIAYLFMKQDEVIYETNPLDELLKVKKLKIISRDEWNASAVELHEKLILPLKKIVIHHTVTRGCITEVVLKNFIELF
jgi:hypothetical protein